MYVCIVCINMCRYLTTNYFVYDRMKIVARLIAKTKSESIFTLHFQDRRIILKWSSPFAITYSLSLSLSLSNMVI